MTGFEPATTRPPDVDSTGLSYIPKCGCKCSKIFWKETRSWEKNLMIICVFSLDCRFSWVWRVRMRGYGVKKLDEPFFLVTLHSIT